MRAAREWRLPAPVAHLAYDNRAPTWYYGREVTDMKTPFGPVTLQCPAGTLYPARYDSINGLWRPIDGTTGEWVSECPCSGCAALRGAGWPDPHAQRVVDHPPLNTPLSAFTPAMLDALPVGSRFGATVMNGDIVEKHADGWHYVDDGSECVDFGPEYDQRRPLIRVGPEQASEPAPYVYSRVTEADLIQKPLPDPWPKMMIEYVMDNGHWCRASIVEAFEHKCHMEGETTIGVSVIINDDEDPVMWTPDHIREVRTPDGVTLWKRPAGGAS